MKEVEKAWLAGIIDGEGSIFIMKQKRKDRERNVNFILRVSVQSTDPYMAQECHNLVGGPILSYQLDKRENNSNTLKWQLNGKKAAKFLQEILPYMRVKNKQAEIAINFQLKFKKHWKHMTSFDYESQENSYKNLKLAKQELKIGKLLIVGELINVCST